MRQLGLVMSFMLVTVLAFGQKKELKKAREYKVPSHLVPGFNPRRNSLIDR